MSIHGRINGRMECRIVDRLVADRNVSSAICWKSFRARDSYREDPDKVNQGHSTINDYRHWHSQSDGMDATASHLLVELYVELSSGSTAPYGTRVSRSTIALRLTTSSVEYLSSLLLKQVVGIHSGMTAERAGLVSSQKSKVARVRGILQATRAP
ncbi:hypothetical protein TNCV_4454681 [Trichonephila clavipes]|nr:hypothetical protein TNCV_4454681 [Trichonephila clavipes]